MLCAAGKGSEIGDFLTTHKLCNAISFTGGDTGISICAKAGMLPIQMELGGKVLPLSLCSCKHASALRCTAIVECASRGQLTAASLQPLQHGSTAVCNNSTQDVRLQDACIVLDDADLKLAASNIVKGGFSYSGQRCTAVKVVLAMESIADELVAAVAKGVDGLSVGKPEVSSLPARLPSCERPLNWSLQHRACPVQSLCIW